MKLVDIATHLNAKIIGNVELDITHLCKIDQATTSGLSFLANKNYAHFLSTTQASAVFVKESDITDETNATLVVVKDPYLAFSLSIQFFYKLPIPFKTEIHPSAVVSETAKIGENATIAPNVYIGENVVIGKNAVIYPNVVIMDDCKIGDDSRFYSNCSLREGSILGNRVTVHNGAVIGSDGFGFAPNPPEGFQKIYQIGIVRIEDDVEIGANTCIDRASMGETVIGKGTKLDNLVQVGHNVRLGEHNVFAGMTAIAGSTTFGNWNYIGGHSAFPGHITIGSGNKIAGKSGPIGNIGDGETLMGLPAMPDKEYKKMFIAQKRLPEMSKQLKAMQREIEELKKKINEI